MTYSCLLTVPAPVLDLYFSTGEGPSFLECLLRGLIHKLDALHMLLMNLCAHDPRAVIGPFTNNPVDTLAILLRHLASPIYPSRVRARCPDDDGEAAKSMV